LESGAVRQTQRYEKECRGDQEQRNQQSRDLQRSEFCPHQIPPPIVLTDSAVEASPRPPDRRAEAHWLMPRSTRVTTSRKMPIAPAPPKSRTTCSFAMMSCAMSDS